MILTSFLTLQDINAALAEDQQGTPVVPKVLVNVETQTDNELNFVIQKLQVKYNDLKNICRYRYNFIKELETKLEQKENSDVNSLSVKLLKVSTDIKHTNLN